MFAKGKDYITGDATAKARLKKEVNALSASMGRQITEGMQQIYQEVFSHIKNARLNWLEQRRAELSKSGSLEQEQKKLGKIKLKIQEGEAIAIEIDNATGANL